jgi:hypothetical protein
MPKEESLRRVLIEAKKETKRWPEWMRLATGLSTQTSETESNSSPRTEQMKAKSPSKHRR